MEGFIDPLRTISIFAAKTRLFMGLAKGYDILDYQVKVRHVRDGEGAVSTDGILHEKIAGMENTWLRVVGPWQG